MVMLFRETGRTLKIGPLDARVALVFLVLPFNLSLNMFFICLFSIFVFAVMNHFGYTFPNAVRRLKVFIFYGKHREAVSKWRRHRWEF